MYREREGEADRFASYPKMIEPNKGLSNTSLMEGRKWTMIPL